MRSPVAGIVTLVLLFLVVIVGYSSIFTVSQTEQALVVRLITIPPKAQRSFMPAKLSF